MGWIRWTGKTLEFVGKLAQAKSFEEWAGKQGERIVTDIGLKTGGYVLGLGKESRAKSIIWEDLETLATTSKTLKTAIEDFVQHYPGVLSNLASKTSKLPTQSYSSNLRVVPRFVVTPHALAEIKTRLDNSQELAKLKGGPSLREYFFKELIEQLESTYSKAAMEVTPQKPLQLDDKWIVGFDPQYQWAGHPGHYYVYSSYTYTRKDAKEKKKGKEEAEQEFVKCQKWLGELSLEERQQLEANLP